MPNILDLVPNGKYWLQVSNKFFFFWCYLQKWYLLFSIKKRLQKCTKTLLLTIVHRRSIRIVTSRLISNKNHTLLKRFSKVLSKNRSYNSKDTIHHRYLSTVWYLFIEFTGINCKITIFCFQNYLYKIIIYIELFNYIEKY